MRNMVFNFDNSRILGNLSQEFLVVKQFKKEYIEFYKTGIMPTHITQMLYYRLLLNKKRLEKMGITLDIFFEDIQSNGRQGNFTTSETFSDGRNKSIDIRQKTVVTKKYIQNGREIGNFKYTKDAVVEVIETLTVDERIACPNCGQNTSLEELLDGCQYCDTHFVVDDFNIKTNSISFREDLQGLMKKSTQKFFGVIRTIYFIIAAIIFSFISLTEGTNFLGIFVGLFASLALMLSFSFFFIIAYFISTFASIGGWTNKEKRIKESRRAFQEHVRRFDPNFSESSFNANIENKIVSILYASSAAEVANIVRFNVSSVLNHYKGVVDCYVNEPILIGFSTDNLYQRLSLGYQIDVYNLVDGKIMLSKENIVVTAIKDINNKTLGVCEARAYKCISCGASISLLEGGTCSYCNGLIDLVKYDWVIENLEIVTPPEK